MPPPKIHHLGCGTMCPRGRRLLTGEGSLLGTTTINCHVLLIEAPGGLVLVDTGFGTDEARDPKLLARPFRALTRPRPAMDETAIVQVRAAGFDPGDVRHIVLTHLDVDHAGGLPDFPTATVHVSAREHEAMLDPPLRERLRYQMGRHQRAHGPRFVTHDPVGEPWQGFEGVRVLPDSDAEILMIPLHGHTLGHAGIAVRRGDGWLLHCGDAYFHRDEMLSPPRAPGGWGLFQILTQANGGLRRENQERLRELASRGEVELICAHDPVQLARAQAAG
jgi:glyoxylase-like metal-dependent hydrolase (beta-lactamase superfamily II)